MIFSIWSIFDLILENFRFFQNITDLPYVYYRKTIYGRFRTSTDGPNFSRRFSDVLWVGNSQRDGCPNPCPPTAGHDPGPRRHPARFWGGQAFGHPSRWELPTHRTSEKRREKFGRTVHVLGIGHILFSYSKHKANQ